MYLCFIFRGESQNHVVTKNIESWNCVSCVCVCVVIWYDTMYTHTAAVYILFTDEIFLTRRSFYHTCQSGCGKSLTFHHTMAAWPIRTYLMILTIMYLDIPSVNCFHVRYVIQSVNCFVYYFVSVFCLLNRIMLIKHLHLHKPSTETT